MNTRCYFHSSCFLFLFCCLLVSADKFAQRHVCLYYPHSGIIALFSHLGSGICGRGPPRGPPGIYEVLTAPRGRLSGSHVTLDLPAHRRSTQPTTQTHRWRLHRRPAITLFQLPLGPRDRPLLSCQRATGRSQRRGRKEGRKAREFLHPPEKLGKTRRAVVRHRSEPEHQESPLNAAPL